MDELIKNIEDLKKIYLEDGDQAELSAWQATVKRALMIKEIAESDGIKMIKEKYQKDIKNINDILLNDEDLADNDRKFLLHRRKWCNDFLKLFEKSDSIIKDAENAVGEQLEEAQNEGLK